MPTPSGIQQTYERIINAAMVAAYWEIGRVIVEEEQQGRQRAGYGKGLLVELSQRLTTEFGRGFDRTNLQQMRAFYLAYQIRDALRHELSWTHYRLLLRVEKPEARAFFPVGRGTPCPTKSIHRYSPATRSNGWSFGRFWLETV
jgi:hypothetical protein